MNCKNCPNEITMPFDSSSCYSGDDYRRQTYRERKRENPKLYVGAKRIGTG